MLAAALDKLRGLDTAHDLLTDPDAEARVEQARTRAARPLSGRERIGEAVAGSTFMAAALALALLAPAGRDFKPWLAIVLVAAYAIAFRAKFEIGAGYTAPTQLVFVPMLFLLPVHVVPLLVAAGNVAGALPDHVGGHRHPERLVTAFSNSWNALGPALVLVLAGAEDPTLHQLPLYAGALVAQFAVEMAVNTPREWFEYGVHPREQLSGIGWVWGIDVLLSAIGLQAALASVDHPAAFALVVPLMALLAVFARERQGRIDSALQLSDAYRGTTMVLADIVEVDDSYTGAHSRTVVSLALQVAEELALDGRARRRTEFGALLHDVGKIAVPKEIINKPGPLTPDEWELIKVHTLDGERILNRVGGFLGEVGAVVRASHERWDGQGYPDGLVREEIPIESRIVSCCDAYNAMTTDRPYRSALTDAEAERELRENSGTQFDPLVVEVLLRVVEREGAIPA